jgi:hypothetical protein
MFFYQDPEWNGNSRLDLTRAIVEQGTFQIDDFVNQPDWATEDRAAFAGHLYSDKAIGSSLMAVPFYFVAVKVAGVLNVPLSSTFARHWLTSIVQGGSFALAGIAMYLLALNIARRRVQALVSALAVALGTMLWPYSAVFYGHVPAAALLIGGFYMLFSSRDAPEAKRIRRFLLAGLAMGAAFITEYTSALIIAGLLLYALYILRLKAPLEMVRAGVAGTIGAIIPLSMAAAYNLSVYGSPFAAGYAFEVENRFQQGMSQGFMGLHLPSLTNTYHITFDPQFGLFWQSPVLLLGAAGLFFAAKERRFLAEAAVSTFAIGAFIAMNGGYYLWWGGSAFGPRFLIPALPFFVVLLALLPSSLTWLVGTLGAVSCAQMFIPVLGQIQPTKLTYRPQGRLFYVAEAPFRGFSLLYDYGVPQILRQHAEGRSPWNVMAGLGFPFWLGVPALILGELLLALGFLAHVRNSSGPGAK